LLSLWRRKWLILLFIGLLGGGTAAVVQNMTPLYTASVKLMFEQQRLAIIPGFDIPTAATEQVEVVRSRAVAQRVVDRLNLRADPEFNTELQPDSAVAELWHQVRDWVWALDLSQFAVTRFSSQAIGEDLPSTAHGDDGGDGGFQLRELEGVHASLPTGRVLPTASMRDSLTRLQEEEILDGFFSRLTVNAPNISNVLEITFVSEEPTKAARIVDEIADSFLEQRLEARFDEIRRSSNWLEGRIGELRQQVEIAEGAVEEYRRRTGLIEGDRGAGAMQQVSELNTQLILARTARAESEARRDQVQQLLQRGSEGLASAVQVLNSPLINNLVAQEVELRRAVSDLSQVYGSRHPQLVNARADLEDLQEKIRLEAGRVAESLQAEVNVARERERLLEQGLNQVETAVADSNQAAVQLRALERDASAARNLLETFLEQAQQLRSQDDLGIQRSDATVISYAAIPRFPSYPRKTLAIAAAMVVGGLLGTIVALLLERFDSFYRSAQQLEEDLGLPVLASVPDMSRTRQVRKRGLPAYLMENTGSAAAEAVRSINARMMLFREGVGALVVQIVSAEPEEGKSSLAIAAAQMHARGGRRVLLIDADFRQSSVASTLNVEASPGLIELMAGQHSFEEVVRRDPATGAHLITTGRFVPIGHDYIVGGRLDEVFARARHEYDVIVVDSPPVLSLADANLIARSVDASIFVSRWGRTRKKTVAYALKQLAASGATIMGVVLSFVDVRRAARYSYGDAGQYSKKYQKYYLDKA
jgi:polysaccharide biosynthesis transport protein